MASAVQARDVDPDIKINVIHLTSLVSIIIVDSGAGNN